MSSSLVITLALIGGIAWLGAILVAALRRRGPEEIPSNLAPGTTDDQMETRRLETGQKTAVLLSAFLAITLPLYYLGEQDRQESFVGQFDEESVARGAALVEEYACFSCHGPEGVGGVAPFVEKRSGVAVSWAAPSLNDVFYRYDRDEVNFWITHGRGNTPMPAWGLAGGGPMNESQVEDVVNYLATIQIPQSEAVAKFEGEFRQAQADRIANSQETAQAALASQLQVLADINRAPDQAPTVSDIAARARELLDTAGQGIDTDGDGLSDSAETGIVALGEELVDALRVIEPVTLDPENPESVSGTDDLTTATAVIGQVQELVDSGEQPALAPQLTAMRAAFDGGVVDPEVGLSAAAVEELAAIAETLSDTDIDVPAEFDAESAAAFVAALEEAAGGEAPPPEVTQAATDARAAFDAGQDPDGDGLSSAAEGAISDQLTSVAEATTLTGVTVANIDPTNATTSGEPDAEVAATVVAGYEGLATNLTVIHNNIDTSRASAEAGVAYLEQALEEQRWEIDIEGVAAATFDGNTEQAERAVLLFNSYCARCHTAGFSAGVPFTLEAGSGGFGPALWDGRPTVQFGEPTEDPADDLLIQFITNGSESEVPYGLNGFGSGRMPAFGQILSAEDIALLARYLRGVDLTGLGDQEVGP